MLALLSLSLSLYCCEEFFEAVVTAVELAAGVFLKKLNIDEIN